LPRGDVAWTSDEWIAEAAPTRWVCPLSPMTKSKLSATIAMRHRPPPSRFGVVTASAREEAVVGRNCKGSPPGGYRAGHASDQATATRPGPAPVPTTSTCGHIPTKDTSWPRVRCFYVLSSRCGGGVQGSVELSGDIAFEAADDLPSGASLGGPPLDVLASGLVVDGADGLVLREGDEARLQVLVRSSAGSAGLARRARIVLLASDGVANEQIAQVVGVSPTTVRPWRGRYARLGNFHVHHRAASWPPPGSFSCPLSVGFGWLSAPAAQAAMASNQAARAVGSAGSGPRAVRSGRTSPETQSFLDRPCGSSTALTEQRAIVAPPARRCWWRPLRWCGSCPASSW
jgi:Winged helix-turn helix